MNDDLISKREALKALSWDTEAYMAINMMPTVDAVPVVRCKNCKHRYHSVECPCQSYDHFYSWMPADDWYCKKGERREE